MTGLASVHILDKLLRKWRWRRMERRRQCHHGRRTTRVSSCINSNRCHGQVSLSPLLSNLF